jgi:hypothetical protein
VLPPWFRTAVGLEESASLIRAYEPQVVPGLLQTEGYVRAITVASFPAAPGRFLRTGRGSPPRPPAPANPARTLWVPITHPCWSGSMPVFVEGAAEPVPSADIEVRDPLRIGNPVRAAGAAVLRPGESGGAGAPRMRFSAQASPAAGTSTPVLTRCDEQPKPRTGPSRTDRRFRAAGSRVAYPGDLAQISRLWGSSSRRHRRGPA